jgi:signal transduction histidine kinase/CheY-like chemotaxis protein
MHRIALLLWAGLLCVTQSFAAPSAEEGLPPLRTWSELDHPGKGQVWRVHQLPNGVMAFANGPGILFFDGSDFDFVEVPGGAVYDFAIGPQQRLYLGTGEVLGYLQPDAQLRWQHVALSLPANAPATGDIGRVVYAHGRAFFLSRRLLLSHSDTDGWRWRATESRYSELQLRDQQVLVHEDGRGWLRFDPGGMDFVSAGIPDLPEGGYWTSSRQDGDPWYATDRKSIYRRSGGNWQRLTLPDADEFIDARIEAMARLPNGDLAVSTRFGGLFQYTEGGQLRRRLASALLPGERITDLGVDAEAGLWLTIDGGIARLPADNRMTHFDRTQGAAQIERMARIDGVLHLATRTGLKRLIPPAAPGLPATFATTAIDRTSTWDLLSTKHGTLVATGSGLSLLPRGREQTPLELLRGARVSALVDAADGWIYAVNGDVLRRLRWDGSRYQLDPQALELVPMFDVWSQQAELWTSVDGGGVFRISGLERWPTPSVTRFGLDQGLPDGRSTFGSDDQGLLIFGAGRAYRPLPDRVVLAAEFPADLDLDRLTWRSADSAWATRDPSGLVELTRRADGHYQIGARPLARWRHPARQVLRDSDGTLWLGDDRGLLRMTAPPERGTWTVAPLLRVSTGSGRSLAAGAGGAGATLRLALGAEDRQLRLSLAWPSYQQGFAPSWRYRYNQGPWQTLTEPALNWSAIPGASQIEVQAIDALGRASPGSVLQLQVTPYWHETGGARLAAALLLVLFLATSAWLYARWRTRKLERERARLELLVHERTAEVSRQAEEIRLLSEARTRFFANVSHEFRTPLTLILGPLGDALQGRFGPLSQGLSAALDTARANGRRLLRLVSELLDLSRLAAGRFELHVAEHDIAEQLRRELAVFQTQAQARQIELCSQGLNDPLLLCYDADQMERMVSNLLSNALKFTPAGGRVSLRLVPTASEVGIEVEDTGPGVPVADQARVFERFYQGAAPAALDAPGTGIGLSLVRELIELHHGRAELHSAPGEGSCFMLWFKRGQAHFSSGQMLGAAPLAVDVASADGPGDAVADSGAAAAARPKLLVVDDHAELRRYLVDRLGDAYQVISVADGEDALAQINEELPDVVVSDVMMPGVDGLTLARALRRDPETAGIALILLSARAHKRDVVAGLEAGADDYLSKPFDTSELIARIEAQLQIRKRLRTQLARELDASEPQSTAVNDAVLVSFESAQQRFGERLRRTLEARLGDPAFGVGELAEALYLDRATLFRRIKSSHQCTPSELLREQRLQRAQGLLREQRGSVSEIAYACGFENLSSFSQTFRKRFGLAPSALLAAEH